MTATDEYLANNARYAESFSGPLPMPPSAHLAVVACMDARLNVYAILGLGDGEAHVIRNAGGVITDDEIRSLAISQRLLGTREILLIHHTDCGMLTFTDDAFKRSIQDDTGISRPGAPRPSPTWTRTCASRSPGSRPARSCRTRTPSAASSSTSPRASSTR
jgi:carbonic anhydrase